MAIRNLQHLLAPSSIAVIAPLQGDDKDADILATQLRSHGFAGTVLSGRSSDPATLPASDLAILRVEASTAGTLRALAAIGTRVALLERDPARPGPLPASERQALLDAARPSGLRLLGPGSVGLAVPGLGVQAIAGVSPLDGHVACIAQSGSVATTLVEWATSRGIGFSHVLTLGEAADIDAADLLDALAGNGKVRALLILLEELRDARKFLSAARALARVKPIILVKTGRGIEAVSRFDTVIADRGDAAWDAACRRSGMLRVRTLDEMFDALETLSQPRPVTGEALAIIANGGGIGLLAIDALARDGGTLAPLAPATRGKLDALLPPDWARRGAIDIGIDADAGRYGTTLAAVSPDPAVGGVLTLYHPHPALDPESAALAVVAAHQALAPSSRSKITAAWLGGESMARARAHFAAAGIPVYDTPERAVRGFQHRRDFARNQGLLLRVPPAVPELFGADASGAREILASAHADHGILEPATIRAILAAYGIAVSLDETPPDGATSELMAGLITDRIFGPLILFGHGGAEADTIDDLALALPPLDLVLARDLIGSTRVGRRLLAQGGDSGGLPEAIALVLVKLSQLAADLPGLIGLTINPLAAGPDGLTARRASARLERDAVRPRFAILPYPSLMAQEIGLKDGTRILVRPIRPEDAARLESNFARTSATDIHHRFFAAMTHLPPNLLVRLTQIDYDREMALCALPLGESDDGLDGYGVVRLAADPDGESGEFAVIVRSDWQGRGLGRILLRLILDYAFGRGMRSVWGTVLRENTGMLGLMRNLGFTLTTEEDPSLVRVTRLLP